jgi:hypothetical protein
MLTAPGTQMSQVVAFLVILEYKIPLVMDPNGGPMHIAEICEKANCADEHKLSKASILPWF